MKRPPPADARTLRDVSDPGQASRFVVNRPKDIHAASRTHRYGHYIRTLSSAMARRSADLRVRSGDRLLDFGCADLPYRSLFPADIGYVAADLPGNPAATVTINPDGTLPVESESFDAVVSTQVLEHVVDPALYLGECFRVLRPGGRLLVSTHGIFVYHPDPVDYWRWTAAGLKHVLEGAGFVVEQTEGVIGLIAIGLQLVQDAVYWKLPRPIRPLVAGSMQALIALADRAQSAGSKRLNASVFILVAVKP